MLKVNCSYCRYEGCIKYTNIGNICKYCNNGIIQLQNIQRKNLLLYSITYNKILDEDVLKHNNDDQEPDLKIYILNINKIPSIIMYENNNTTEITSNIWNEICNKYNKQYEEMILKFCSEDAEYYYEYMSECYEYT
jgi:hypothetical protein